MAEHHPIHGRIDGPVVMIGFGSIGKGTWPLIERHFEYDAEKFTVIEPDPDQANFLRQHKIRHLQVALTRENYRDVLGELFPDGKGFCVNLSVDTSSLDLMKLCRKLDALYIDFHASQPSSRARSRAIFGMSAATKCACSICTPSM